MSNILENKIKDIYEKNININIEKALSDVYSIALKKGIAFTLTILESDLNNYSEIIETLTKTGVYDEDVEDLILEFKDEQNNKRVK